MEKAVLNTSSFLLNVLTVALLGLSPECCIFCACNRNVKKLGFSFDEAPPPPPPSLLPEIQAVTVFERYSACVGKIFCVCVLKCLILAVLHSCIMYHSSTL